MPVSLLSIAIGSFGPYGRKYSAWMHAFVLLEEDCGKVLAEYIICIKIIKEY